MLSLQEKPANRQRRTEGLARGRLRRREKDRVVQRAASQQLLHGGTRRAMQKLKYQPPIFLSDNEFGKWLRAGLRQSGITFEETLQTQVAVTTPNQPVGMLPRRIVNRQAEFLPAGKFLRLRHRQEQLGCSQLIFVHERQPLFDQVRRVPPDRKSV